jgi:hypothetical protein
MNARDIIQFGQQHVHQALKELPEDAWGQVGVTTRWTVRDLIGHLASFELALEGALKEVAGEGPTPTLDAMRADHPGTSPWYGADYALDDLIVYMNYAHKREHCAQIRAFRLRIGK